MRVSTVITRGALVGLCIIAGTLASISSDAAAVSGAHIDTPTQDELRQEFAATGLTPELLCIAGLTPTETTSLVAAALGAITEHWPALEQARQSVATTRASVARLEALVARGVATSGDHESLTVARAELASAESGLAGVLGEVRSAINQELGTGQLAVLDRLLQNARLPVPVEFHVLDRTPVEWVQFRKAYSECQTNPAPSVQASTLVAACDTDYDVVLARTRLQADLASVRGAFLAALD